MLYFSNYNYILRECSKELFSLNKMTSNDLLRKEKKVWGFFLTSTTNQVSLRLQRVANRSAFRYFFSCLKLFLKQLLTLEMTLEKPAI